MKPRGYNHIYACSQLDPGFLESSTSLKAYPSPSVLGWELALQSHVGGMGYRGRKHAFLWPFSILYPNLKVAVVPAFLWGMICYPCHTISPFLPISLFPIPSFFGGWWRCLVYVVLETWLCEQLSNHWIVNFKGVQCEPATYNSTELLKYAILKPPEII